MDYPMSSPTSELSSNKMIRLTATDNPQVAIYEGREIHIPSLQKKVPCEVIHKENLTGKVTTIFLKITPQNTSEK